MKLFSALKNLQTYFAEEAEDKVDYEEKTTEIAEEDKNKEVLFPDELIQHIIDAKEALDNAKEIVDPEEDDTEDDDDDIEDTDNDDEATEEDNDDEATEVDNCVNLIFQKIMRNQYLMKKWKTSISSLKLLQILF